MVQMSRHLVAQQLSQASFLSCVTEYGTLFFGHDMKDIQLETSKILA